MNMVFSTLSVTYLIAALLLTALSVRLLARLAFARFCHHQTSVTLEDPFFIAAGAFMFFMLALVFAQ